MAPLKITEKFMDKFLKNYAEGISLVLLLVFSRWIPHWPNVTGLGAILVLAPVWGVKNSLPLILSLLGMVISDSVIGFHSSMVFTYAAIALYCLWSATQGLNSPQDLRGTNSRGTLKRCMVWSGGFYLISNGGAWWTSAMYPKTLEGLIRSLENGLPFLAYEALGTLFYVGIALALRESMERFLWKHSQ